MSRGICRFCKSTLEHSFVDLGMSPLSNAFLKAEHLGRMEPFYPLHVYVCGQCFLVQLEEFEAPEAIFNDYAYFSSYAESWVEHARIYVDAMIDRFGFGTSSRIIEVASNDGYLLQFFTQRGIPVLGIEPAENVAKVAQDAGIPTMTKFFGKDTATELVGQGICADLLIGNNVLAHVPNLNDFLIGMKTVLKPDGVITVEFPHLLRLMQENQFDTIYHEHFSYFSFMTAQKVFAAHDLVIFDVEQLTTHGGSLRVFARHSLDESKATSESVSRLIEEETRLGLDALRAYEDFSVRVQNTKRKLLELLIGIRQRGESIAGYGAPAKGNTLLNYCGVRTDFLEFTVDRSPHKQGRYLPGTHIPVLGLEEIERTKPDYLLVLPWNLKDEIMEQMSTIRKWGGRFIVPIPEPRVLP